MSGKIRGASPRRQKSKRRPTLFDPDKIIAKIHQAITRDLQVTELKYGHERDARLLFKQRQIGEFLKRYFNPSKPQDSLIAATYRKFLAENEHMGNFRELEYPETLKFPSETQCRREKILLRARALMHWCLTAFDEDEFFGACKHGPGTTLGVPFEDTSLESKFTLPMSCTESVKPLLDQYLAWDHQSREAIVEYNAAFIGEWYDTVDGSRATTVTKDDSIRRFISVEPTGNAFIQQGLMHMMYSRLRKVGLDVRSLPMLHQKLAKKASMDGRKATVDFISASNCVLTELSRFLMPRKWFRVCDMSRCTATEVDGEWVQLNMFSTMGNAVTFPLETLIFWTLGQAMLLTDRAKATDSLFPEWEDLAALSVFGDDCIVPDESYDSFVDLLESFGFMVNTKKSHHGVDPFRESCGGDYHLGHDVRPFKVRPPTSLRRSALEPWLNIIANNLIERYILYFGDLGYVYDRELFRVLIALFREHDLNVRVVPADFPEDSGWFIAEDLQRWIHAYGDIPLARIAVADYSLGYEFSFLKFRYWKTRSVDHGLRYTTWLRNPVVSEGRAPTLRPVRKRGGYVVAKGISSGMRVLYRRPRG